MKTRLSTAETVAGFCYLPVYAVLLAFAMARLAELANITLTDLQFNICWFVLNAVFVWIIFHNFLLRSFRGIRFWDLVQALILGFVFYYAGNYVLLFALDRLGVEAARFNDQTVMALAAESEIAMIVCGVLLAPVVEETLVRGLVFGTVRQKNRVLAYALSVLLFAAIHVWQYIPANGIGPVALSALLYLPAGAALAWTYEKAGTVWAPIALHMFINAISFGIMTIF